VHLAPTFDHEGRPFRRLSQRGLATRHLAHHQAGQRCSTHVHRVGRGAESDVVAEDGGEFVRVRVAADPREQSGVVDGLAAVAVQVDLVRQPHGQHAGPQHVLHGLPEPEVDGQ
jgi:hypothetical protein